MSILLSLLGFGRAALSAVVGWLSRRSLSQIVCIILACALVLALLRAHHWKAVASNRQAQLVKCQAARKSDRDAYAKAQSEAQAKNAATVARDRAERERITHEFDNYQSELDSLRSDLARRLRQPSAQGSAGKPDLPNISPAPSGPDGAPRVSVPTGLYVRGAELELQLERLQQWVAEQLKVDPNK
jgi:multidrug efflux pump subunit AcrA (membrane-fusion protein)